MDDYKFKMHKLMPLKDTPEKHGFKEHHDLLYLNKEGLLQIGFITEGIDNQGKSILKFPSNATHIVKNVELIF